MSGWLSRRRAAFAHAGRGVAVLLRQPHGKIHAVAAVGVVLMGAVCGLSSSEWVALTLCIALVLAAEAINTALERVVDLVSPDWHELARDAKDLAAGAVLIAAIGAAIVGLLIFLPHL